MIKPPDNLNSNVNDPYRRPYGEPRNKQHCPRHQQTHCSLHRCNEQLHQQYQSEKIYQNCKYYPYRTWKWLQHCRIAYPSPYSGPGPGPGPSSVAYPDLGTTSMSSSLSRTTTPTTPVVSPAVDCPVSTRQTIDESVIILSPSLLVPSKWIKSRRRAPVVASIAAATTTTTTTTNTTTTTISETSTSLNRCKHQNNFDHNSRPSRKSWMLGRKVWWLLFVLACFDNGRLLVNCQSTSAALVKLTTIPTMPTTPTIPKDDRSQTHAQHTASNFQLNVSVNVNNAHHKFLINNNNNNNAYNNRNDIIKNSNNNNNNNNAYNNFKYSTNDYKNLLISYNDIYTNNNGNYSTNLYYNANNSEFDTSNRKFSYSRRNNKSTSNRTDTSDNKSNSHVQLKHRKIDSSYSYDDFNANHYNQPLAATTIRSNPLASDAENQLASLSASLVVASQQKPTHTSSVASSLVSAVISQQTDSMKASLNAINHFKASANTIASPSNQSPVIALPDDGVERDDVEGVLIRSENRLTDSDVTSKSLKNKRTIDTSLHYTKQVQQSERRSDDDNDDNRRHYPQEYRHQFNQHNDLEKQQPQQQQQIQHYHKQQQNSNLNEYSTTQSQQQMSRGAHHTGQRQRDIVQQPYHYDHTFNQPNYHPPSHRNNPIHEHQQQQQQQQDHFSPTPIPPQTRSIKSSYSNTFPYDKQNLPLDENYKRSILASISCPNCVYNIESYLASELYAPSILSTPSLLTSLSSEQMLRATSLPQPSPMHKQSQLSSSSLSPSSTLSLSSSSSSNAFKRYHNINDQNNPAKSTFHQYQQQQPEQQQHQQSQEEIHQQQHYPHHTVISSQYYNTNDNNNNNNHNNNNNNHYNIQSNPSFYNNPKLTYYNTINRPSNFHQRFHQIDSDQIRLESIKHQILSKLGLKSKPNVTQTLPKQFIMETIYRAESSGRSQSFVDFNNGKRHSDKNHHDDDDDGGDATNMIRMRDQFRRDSSRRSDSDIDIDRDGNDRNDGDSSDRRDNRNYNRETNEFHRHHDNIHTETLVRNHLLPSSLSSPSLLTRRFDAFENGNGNGNGDDPIESNIESDREINHNQYYNGNSNSMNSDFASETSNSGASFQLPAQPVSASSSSTQSSTPVQANSAEQDDFYGRTKEIITFAEMGDVLNGHRLIEFSSLSDQMSGQNLRIRAASMWIRADLRPIVLTKPDRSSRNAAGDNTFASNRLKSTINSDSKVKLWVFRLIEPYANTWNSTKFVKKSFDEITTLSTTLNVRVNQLGWQKLDITETVQSWYTNDRHVKLRLLVDCSGCGDRVTLHLFDGEKRAKSWHGTSKSSYKSDRHHHRNHHHHHHHHHHHRHHLQSSRKPGHNPKYRHLSRDRVHHRTSKNRTVSVPGFADEVETGPRLSRDQEPERIQRVVYGNETRARSLRRHDNELSRKKKAIATLPGLDDHHRNWFSTDDATDRQKVDPNRPFLVIHTEPNAMKRVRRRALDCAGALNGQCCKESFYVSFKALGWDDWIIAPHGYFANYCRGDCAGPRTPDTYQSYHTHVMEEFRKLDRLTGMQPCCAPLKFSSMSLIYYGKEGIIKRDLPKMVVDECGCP